MFNLKIYDIGGVFKDTITISELKNNISFTAAENQGQGQCSLLLNHEFENDLIINTDFIKIYQDTNLIYTGIVQDVKRKITNTYEEVEIPLLGIGTLTGYLLFEDTGSYIFSKNQDPSQTIRDIIDYINTVYTGGWLSYDGSSIEDYGSVVDIEFENDTCFEALEKCIEVTDFKLYIDQDGVVNFKAKPSTSTHTFTVGEDIEEIRLEEDSEDLVNKLILEWKSGTTPYEDIGSQAINGMRELFLKKSSIVDQSSANIFGNNYISEYKDPINKTSIIINRKYDLSSIRIGDTIEVKNFKFEIKNLQIVKYTYTIDKMKLDLESFDSFGREFNS